MPGLVPGIHFCLRNGPGGDARNKSGHDDGERRHAGCRSESRSRRTPRNPVESKPSALSPKSKPDSSGTSPGMTGRGHDGEGSGRRLRTETRCVYAVAQAGGESSSVLPGSSKPYPSASCMSFRHPVSFHSVPVFPPPGLPEQRDPDSRVSCARLCRRGRVSAPARFARLIARTRGRYRGTLRLSAESGSFRTGPAREEKRPRECRPHPQVRYYHRYRRSQCSF